MQSIQSVDLLPSEIGPTVFANDEHGIARMVMLTGTPMTSVSMSLSDILEFVQSIDSVIGALPVDQLEAVATNNAVASLQRLKWKLEFFSEEASKQHARVVEKMSVDSPDLLQDYLKAFSAAVGQGDV